MGKLDAYGALKDRERVQEEIRDLVVGFTQILEGIYRVAGRQDLGDRIRLPLPHSTSPAEADEPDPPDGETETTPLALPEAEEPALVVTPVTGDPTEALPIVAIAPREEGGGG
jgi:hypothetical protein